MGAPPAGSPRWRERPRPSGRGGRHYHRTVAGRGTPATVLLTELGVAYRVHAYDHDPRHGGYGVEASDALGIAPERVFKTLGAEVDGPLPVVLDSSALGFATIFCSGGRRGLEIELAPADLVRAAGARVAAIAQPGA